MERRIDLSADSHAKDYEKIYGIMTRAKAYGATALLAGAALMCVVEPIFLGFVVVPVLFATIAPNGLRELKKEFSKEGFFLRDAARSIGRDVRGLAGFFGIKSKVQPSPSPQTPAAEVEGAGSLSVKTSRPDFLRGSEEMPVTGDIGVGTPANANEPAQQPRKASGHF